MFILAFFGFLRCSELAITSNFSSKIHPTISDLSLVDDETISYFIKQSKTDQSKKGHFIYIFNLHSPIQPYQTLQSYLHFRNSTSKDPSDPFYKRFKPTSHALLVSKTSQISPNTIWHPSQALFRPLFSHRRRNHSCPKRTLTATDPSSWSLVI